MKPIILMLVRWCLAYSLSYRNIEELANERGLSVDHSTIQRLIEYYSPQLEETFRKNKKRTPNGSWRMDKTYLKIKGKDVYLYRAVDKFGEMIDFMLSEKHDKATLIAYFNKCIGQRGLPEKVTIDKSGANKASIDAINLKLIFLYLLTGIYIQITVRQIKYLNNIVEQDHRFIKRITRPMKGFKSFDSAKATVTDIELHHMIKKSQCVNAQNMAIYEQFYALAA